MVLTHISREGGLEARLPLLSLQRLYESRLLATDVRAGAAHHKHVKVVPGATGVPADQPGGVGLVDGDLRSERNHRLRRRSKGKRDSLSTLKKQKTSNYKDIAPELYFYDTTIFVKVRNQRSWTAQTFVLEFQEQIASIRGLRYSLQP